MKLPAGWRVLGLSFLLFCISFNAFAQGRCFLWNPTMGFGTKRWDNPANWLPAEPPSSPGPQDTAVVQGVSSTGSLLTGVDVWAPADVKVLSAVSGAGLEMHAPLTVLESSMFEGIANYVNASRAKSARVFGTNSLILLGEENYFGRWTQISCNVENHGYAVIQNIGEIRGDFKESTWHNHPGSRLDLNAHSIPELGHGTPAAGAASVWGTFPQIANDSGAEVIVEIAEHLVKPSQPETFLVSTNAGLLHVKEVLVQILGGDTFGGRLEVDFPAAVRLGRSQDIPGPDTDTLRFAPGTVLTGAGSIGFAANGNQWFFDDQTVINVAITNRAYSRARTISGGPVTFRKNAQFADPLVLGNSLGFTDFWGETRFESSLTLQRDIDNFGTMIFTRDTILQATVTPLVRWRNQPGGRIIMQPSLEGAINPRDWRESGVTAIFQNLPGATLHFVVTNDTTAARNIDWDFVNDGFIRLDGCGLRFRDHYEQGPLGALQLDTGAFVQLYKTTNMAGRIVGSGRLVATNLLYGGELSPQSNLDAFYSPGELTLEGSFALAPLARTTLELSGRPGDLDTWDRLLVNGEITLGGTLSIVCTNGLPAAHGDRWRVLEVAGEKIGEFDQVHFVNLPAGFLGFVEPDATGITVELRQVGDPVNYFGWSGSNAFPNANAALGDSDPDDDGFANALEYAFGSDPLAVDEALMTLDSESIDGASHMVLRFTRPAGPARPGDLEWIYETSTDLVTWERVYPVEVVGPMDESFIEPVEARFPATHAAEYVRIKLSVNTTDPID